MHQTKTCVFQTKIVKAHFKVSYLMRDDKFIKVYEHEIFDNVHVSV